MTPEEEARYRRLFSMPNPVRITGRSSSITNSFVNGLIPVVTPTSAEIRTSLEVLEMLDGVCCAYCGGVHSEWDHLRPLVVRKRPTGFISEIQNLVPACGKCNQSKGNKPWRTWMFSDARLSPKTRGVADKEQRAARLDRYEEFWAPTHVDFESAAGQELWQTHWENHQQILAMMRQAELVATQIRGQVARLREGENAPREIAG